MDNGKFCFYFLLNIIALYAIAGRVTIGASPAPLSQLHELTIIIIVLQFTS